MAENAAQSIKELQERLVAADKTLGEVLQRIDKYDDMISHIFSEAARNAKLSFDDITDYITKKMRRENLKQSESLMKDILGTDEAKKEIEKMPTMFDRVISQINQRAQQSGENFAKKLVNAESAKNEAEEFARSFLRSFQKAQQQIQQTKGSVVTAFSDVPQSLQPWINTVFKYMDTSRGHQALVNNPITRYAEALKQLQELERRYEGTDNALGRIYKNALIKVREYIEEVQKVKQLEEQAAQSQQKYASNVSAIEGITRRYNDNEQAIQRIIEKWEELNVKKQAGLVNDKDFKTQTQKILDEYDRLIAKRREFEIEDLGKMSSERTRQREEEEERLNQLRKSNTQARLDDEMRAERMIKQARAERAKKEAEADANMKKAVSQQVTSYKQLSALLKQYNSLKQVKGRTQEEEAALERTRQKIKEIIAEMRKLDSEQKGSLGKARDITEYDRILAKDREITNEKKKQNDLTKQQKANLERLLPTIQRLASAFGVAFSVRGLAQFGKKLVETRGEFEMQFVAMKQIIGDMDAATKIWNQTMQQALQSPFKAMQLVTYTKQLAAYRIETEKLFDTTKRLADISAGLGVDMGRLILAFGQVKSANFLRASEVRQFTEAGVNIVGNLAQYFTELEGRAVGTAEVMERITKRMVLFSDVEAILKRMTDEGGEFYNMQEVQADTVKGQINKLRDAYDQMLNTIGQAKQGTIRKFVDTLNNLVRNWQNVAFVLKANINWYTGPFIAALALASKYLKTATTQTLWFSKSLTGNQAVLLKEAANVRLFGNEVGVLTMKQRLGVIAIRNLQGALSMLGKVLKTIGPLLAVEGIVILIERLTRANRELKRFREELQEVTSSNVGQMDEEINGYDKLIKKLKQTTDGTMARKEVLDEISRRYGKYLDFIVTEKTTIEELAGAYDKVVSSIRNYTAEKIREEQQQKLEKGLYDEYQDLIKNLTEARVDIGDKTRKLSSEQAKRIAKIIQQELEKSGVLSPKDVQDILSTYFGETVYATLGGANTNILGYVGSYQDAFSSLKGELQEIRDEIEGVTPVFSSEAEYEQYKKNVEEAKKEIAAQNDLYQQQVDLVKQKTEEQWKLDDEIAKLRLKNEEEILRIRKEYGLISEGQYNDELARLHGRLDTYETDYNKRLAKAMSESYGETWQTSNKEARDMYNYVVSTEQALAQGTTQRNKQLKESYKGFKDSLEQYNAQFEAAVNSGASKEALDKIQADIDLAKLMMAAIELAANLRGIDLSEKKTTTRKTHENASRLISLIKEMRSEYDKLSKSAYGYAKSEEKVRDSFKQSYEDILKETGVAANFDFTTNQGEIEALKKVRDYIKGNAKYAKDAWKDVQKTIDQLAAETEIEISVRIREDFGKQMEKAFNDYELTLELDKLNLPKGLAADMWGIEETDLQDLRKKLSQMYMGLRDENGQLSDEAFKDYEKFLNKIDDLERKQQKERLKDYSKYLEAQYSERVKIEMDYVRKLAALEAETAIKEPQKREIREGLKREFLEKSRKQDWEDFKGSEFYVGMMEDLEKQGSASLEVMRKKLLEMRENAENLSPRALKEVVNALEKIDELEKKRIPPLKRIREEQEKLKGIEIKDVYERIAANQEKLAQDEQEQKDLERMIMLEEERQKLEKQGVTLDRAKTNLSMFEGYRAVAEGNLRRFKSDGSKESQAQLVALKEDLNQWSMLAEKWAEIVRILSGQATIDEQERGSRYGGLSLSDLKKRRDDAKQRIKDLEGVIGKDEELVKAQKDLEDAWNDTWEAAKRWAQSINGIFDGVMDTIGYFSDSTSTLTAEWKEFGDTSISALTELVSGIQAYQQANAAAQKAGLATGLFTANGLQLAMVVLGVIIKVVQAIAKLHDARIDKEIEQSKERVDELQKAYERLEKQIEKTFDTVSYMMEFNKETQNLYEQIEEANNQIAAAQEYKSADKRKEAIEAAEEAKQQALDALDEIKQAQIEVFGGIGEVNYRSAAEGFVDAWKSAFLETGDGLQGLQDHFDEFLNDWFVKQATMRIAANNLAPLFRKIDDAVDQYGVGGAEVTWQELQEINDLKDLLLTQTNEQLKELADVFGIGGEGSLSGLAAGIQGMTEEQANILEAYWNSVRMYTANIDMNVARIAETLGAGGVNTNPQLQQLNLIAANTAATQTLLQSVTKSGHGLGGSGIKVFVD